ncbi:monovalent cation/H+ antiporter complex subunit F [Aquamicrobium sp. LC103]|uniref:monovalent cation/H+ antiporter complex subunit F n=1 Tax=Aquamicrobium sp. LC103 TaxID=1120658 RepID=UPI00063EB7FA|nr:monovalent cation/H+ antiporter complex subunit F [Aquamicrobium sp. LC103]TKT82525.1 cation:proton antiporter [Aquamicrobium sp. LC103]
MSAEAVQLAGIAIAGVLLLAAMICAGARIIRGPGGPDRVVALDMLSLLGVAATGIAVLASGSTAFIDIALGVALVGFLATVAFAGFIERGSINEEGDDE